MWEVKIIEDSVAEASPRLTTFQLRYPRIVHQELLTHRAFSRNAQSSRAVPSKKLIEEVRSNPAMPVEFGKNAPGMQALELLENPDEARAVWIAASQKAADSAEAMLALGAHKQIVNRLLEPFQWISVIVTATDYKNFFDLRCHKDADPTIRKLAEMMRDAYTLNIPKKLGATDWHLPYVTDEERANYVTDFLLKLSTARCARVSYNTHSGVRDNDKDCELAKRLLSSKHLSPFEHQAKPGMWGQRNFDQGWTQHRVLVSM